MHRFWLLGLSPSHKHETNHKLHFHKLFNQARIVKANVGLSLSGEKLIMNHADIIGPMLSHDWYDQKSLLISDSFEPVNTPDMDWLIVLLSVSDDDILMIVLICTFCRFFTSASWTPVKIRARARRWEQDTSAPACPASQVNSCHESYFTLMRCCFSSMSWSQCTVHHRSCVVCSSVTVIHVPDVPLMFFSLLRCKVWDWRGRVRLGSLPERWSVHWWHRRLSVSVQAWIFRSAEKHHHLNTVKRVIFGDYGKKQQHRTVELLIAALFLLCWFIYFSLSKYEVR